MKEDNHTQLSPSLVCIESHKQRKQNAQYIFPKYEHIQFQDHSNRSVSF